MSQIATTIEQSKRLLDAGLDPVSADMYYKNNLPWTDKEPRYSAVLSDGSPVEALEWYNKGYTAGGKEPLPLLHFCFPAWSLSRLWDICNDSGIGPFNFGGNSIESSEIVAKLVEWIILGVHDYEVLDEYLNEETRQEQSHANH